MSATPTILLSPLDWGLGHTTRLIPIGRELRLREAKLVLAGTRQQLDVLSEELQAEATIELPSYGVRYGKRLPASWHVIRQFPRLLSVIRKEQAIIHDAVSSMDIHGIISDNRYGVYDPRVSNVMVMHQFVPPINGAGKLFRKSLWKRHQKFLAPFDELWIPDHEDQKSLASDMRYPFSGQEARYLGWLSRLKGIVPQAPAFLPEDLQKPDLLCLLSGPEPQRTILEEKIRKQMPIEGFTVWIVQGLPGGNRLPRSIPGGLLIPYLDASSLSYWLPKAGAVLSRSGYSTLMDLASIGTRHMILIPTPGQPEQVHLAKKLQSQKRARMATTKNLDINSLINSRSEVFGFRRITPETNKVRLVVGQWLQQLS